MQPDNNNTVRASALRMGERPGNFPKPLPPSEFPAQLPADIVAWCKDMEATGKSGKGKLNIYTCDTCRGHIITRDLDTGVTPFMTSCHATPDCKGSMSSSFYRVAEQRTRASRVWARPIISDLLKPDVLEHVMKGGLILREPTEDEREYC